MKLLHLGHEEVFALNRSIHNLVEAGRRRRSLLRGNVAGRELGCRRSLHGCRLGRRSLGERSLDEQGRGAADQGERKECE